MGVRTAARVAIALALIVGTAPVAAADEQPGPAEAAASWLAGQLADGTHMTTTFDGTAYPDHGLTADVVLALDAGGVAQDAASAATAWLAANSGAYLGEGDEAYAGAHAKLALVAQAQGADPTDFGGVDLIARLTALQTDSGRFSDKSQYGDYSNGISQALAVLALHRAGGAPADAVDFLAKACPDGGFRLLIDQEPCVSDVDATGYAVQALVAVGRDASAALDWLEGKQRADGGFPGSDPTPGVNANSTGLAATALAVGGRDAAAAKAVTYLLKRQVDCSGKAAARGAIAYDEGGFDSRAARATAQAIPGIVGVSLAEVSADGAAADARGLTCATQPTSSTPPGTTQATTTAPATTTTKGGVVPAADIDDLADTGVEVGPAVGLGALLVLGGAGLLFVVRRRHAS
ncbi:prenyltransferase/squalene oxidase repeat-containing protein [Actinokineospora fastidiosa]|uniref:Cell wall anchor n=1 Tax=Actinokineospora fastidiosa TaxID=1816 RepID=A0A918GBS5_9PSEU|nr:prenyltransferase/squalene oxidase repeat-containing protein [Actinokineospora fastidiosa]GGS27540.1 cell wall anchor [Actinokineospora fastidiosa]